MRGHRRFPILRRFVWSMLLVLVLPLAVLTVVVLRQLRDDGALGARRILEGTVAGLVSTLTSEANGLVAELSTMVNSGTEPPRAAGYLAVSMVGGHPPAGLRAADQALVQRVFQAAMADRPRKLFLADATGLYVAAVGPRPRFGDYLVCLKRLPDVILTLVGTSFDQSVSFIDLVSRRPLFPAGFLADITTQKLSAQIASRQSWAFWEEPSGDNRQFVFSQTLGDNWPEPILAVVRMPVSSFRPLDLSPYLFVFAGVVLILSGLLSFLLIDRVVRPLTRLALEVNRLRHNLKNGEEGQSLHVRSNDEIGDVSNAFNALIRQLYSSLHKIDEQRAQIISYTQTLEERVQDRTRELEEARIRAEVANAQKSRFLVNMNHELRTPLNSISGITDLLRYGAYDTSDAFAKELAQFASEIGELAASPSQQTLVAAAQFLAQVAELVANDANTKRALAFAVAEVFAQPLVPAAFAQRASLAAASLAALAGEEEAATLAAYNAVREAGDSLLEIINEVINLSRVESGVIALSQDHVKMSDLIDHCLIQAQGYLRAKHKHEAIRLSCVIHPDVPDFVYLDDQKIKQVTLNLLTNAIKYTDAGTIAVTVSFAADPSHPHIRVAVQDTGIGIADHDKPLLFMEFSRAFEVREIEGTGLGLALSRKLVERMGGSVGFESTLGQGSLFWFTVPIAATRP